MPNTPEKPYSENVNWMLGVYLPEIIELDAFLGKELDGTIMITLPADKYSGSDLPRVSTKTNRLVVNFSVCEVAQKLYQALGFHNLLPQPDVLHKVGRSRKSRLGQYYKRLAAVEENKRAFLPPVERVDQMVSERGEPPKPQAVLFLLNDDPGQTSQDVYAYSQHIGDWLRRLLEVSGRYRRVKSQYLCTLSGQAMKLIDNHTFFHPTRRLTHWPEPGIMPIYDQCQNIINTDYCQPDNDIFIVHFSNPGHTSARDQDNRSELADYARELVYASRHFAYIDFTREMISLLTTFSPI